jgi:DNA-binding NarL/FixJ family response regulator
MLHPSQSRCKGEVLAQNCSLLVVSILHQRRQSLRSLANSLGLFNCITTTDYDHAWAIIQEGVPHVLIMDNWFSGFDVRDLLTRVKDAYPQVRCIVLDDAFQGGHLPALQEADVILNSDLPTSHLLDAVRQQALVIQNQSTVPNETG